MVAQLLTQVFYALPRIHNWPPSRGLDRQLVGSFYHGIPAR
jgi:hypothetical protein